MSGPALLPAAIVPLLNDLTDGLRSLSPSVLGAWVTGSVSLGAFDARRSDVDVIVVADRPLSPERVGQVAALHARVERDHALARQLEVQYLPMEALRGGPVQPYPVADHGEFIPAGQGDLDATLRWLLREHGITLFGPPASALPIVVLWDDVLATMRSNLTVEWDWSATRAPLPVLAEDEEVFYAVATLCRILSTVEDGTVVSKQAAVEAWSDRVPPRWSRLLGEARRLRDGLAGAGSYAKAGERAHEVQAFVGWARRRGLHGLGCELPVHPSG